MINLEQNKVYNGKRSCLERTPRGENKRVLSAFEQRNR